MGDRRRQTLCVGYGIEALLPHQEEPHAPEAAQLPALVGRLLDRHIAVRGEMGV